MANILTEEEIEQMVLQTLQEQGYEILNGSSIGRQYNEVILTNRLQIAIDKINPEIPAEVREEALRNISRIPFTNLLANNEAFHKLLTEGVDVKGRDGEQIKTFKVWLVDFQNPENNDFIAVNQFTIVENHNNKRPDVIIFVNGLPLVVIEIKNATDEKADLKAAYNQLMTYKQAIPTLFNYNSFLIITDGWFAKAGTITSDWNRFNGWKIPVNPTQGIVAEPSNIYGSTLFPTPNANIEMDVVLSGMLHKKTIIDLIRYFIVFEKNKDKTLKKIAAYHQYYAVDKAIHSTIKAAAASGDKRAGVVWHTQGSGKSLSMVFYVGKMVVTPQLNNPTIVVLTDRNDLDQQLFETFSNCQQLIRQTPVQAESRSHLQSLLSVASGGVVFTTIQKFMPEEKGATYPKLSDRRNIVVIADEAHRSQYDFIDGYARHMRDALPYASFIGFTGTPIEKEDKNTQAIFGEYVDIYDIQQAVEDGATVRIFYESRLAKIELDPAEQAIIDQRIEEVTEEDELTERQQRFAKWTQQEAIVGSDKRLRQVASDLVKHFEQRSEPFDGKGMIVCMSRRICVALHNEIIKIRPEWYSGDDDKGAIKVIMTGSSSDPLDWQEHIRNKPRRKSIGDRLKDPKNELKLVIVRDMWLTGFDAPCLHTLYVDKPMTGHNLMQAIARVNRVFKDKEGGLIVDYLGIAQDLKKALSVYTSSGGKGKIEFDQEEAVAKMQELYEIVVDLFHGFDYNRFFNLQSREKLTFLLDATDFILGLDKGQERFSTNVSNLSKAFAISVPHPKAIAIRDDLSFFQAVKARIAKLRESKKKRTDEEVETAIRQIISDALISTEVIDIFQAAGLQNPEISGLNILSDEFMAELKNMPRKNLALELLRRLLNDEIRQRSSRNIVQSKKFSEMLAEAIKRYQNNALTAAEIIEELISLAKKIKEADKRGENLNLDFRELAFYDALEIDDSAVQILGNEILKTIARELVTSVKNSVTIDWDKKESVQAKMRVMIKRILKKYGYPPEKQDQAVKTILEQAKLIGNEFSIHT
ncbi:type I restriction endonuclease subunit R [Flavobacterium sp. MAH-1]|uniref:Type I restriction enzyme endonuclease subunit n=1 Tax=Flavobacterium agri TaxID=2743471 RepID=A0A7Y8Y4N2_9FLAO|nr:type I restriction endonuclease subunit R [Flavobacterium agri]NUY82357.1 type I restriction endonuclease subunit R [Flavobacterium agri]NYA72381.1 type I restriction endonuclease subunit R [Flavobacterium agri]